jgi:hypothetical protein
MQLHSFLNEPGLLILLCLAFHDAEHIVPFTCLHRKHIKSGALQQIVGLDHHNTLLDIDGASSAAKVTLLVADVAQSWIVHPIYLQPILDSWSRQGYEDFPLSHQSPETESKTWNDITFSLPARQLIHR